jgi:hypothetical protein
MGSPARNGADFDGDNYGAFLQGGPLTLEGGPDEYKILLGHCSDLSTLWRQLLHWCVQAFVTEDKEAGGTASRAVSLLGLDPGRIVFDDLGLHLYVGGVLCRAG